MRILYILNIAKRVNNFSYTSMVAAQNVGFEYQIAGNWEYENEEERKVDEVKYGIKIHQVDFIRTPFDLRNFRAYRQIVEIVKREQIDVIHCNTPIGGVVGRLAGKKCGVKKVIYQAHGFHFYKGAPKKNWLFYYPVERFLAHYTDILITINQEDYNAAQKFKLRNKGKVYYVPGVGIDLKQYTSDIMDDTRIKLRTEFGFDDNTIVCISMGDLILRKNYGIAISAVGKLQDKYPNLHYIICGEGQELNNLKVLAKKCNVDKKVHFLGFRKDIKNLLRASDIFLFTSLQEGLPRSTMEAMASGLPIACSRIRGNTDLVDEGKGGVLFDPQNIDEIVSEVNKLLSSDMEAMSKHNLDRIHDFSLDTVSESIVEVYKNMFSPNISGGMK